MFLRRMSVLLLFIGGCSSEPGDERAEGSDTTSGGETGTTRSETQSPATSDTSSSATTADADSETGLDPDTGGSTETGEESKGSPGCDAREALEDGEHQFSLDGYDRRYILRLPQSYSNERPWPLIFALHGNGGNPGYWDGIGGDRDIRTAFENDAILVIPEAIGNAWRDYDAPADTWPARMELELSFFDTVYDEVRNHLCVDDDNVFSMGFSGGGSFSGVLGCRRDYIRAIAVGGSVIYFETEDCVETPAAWITIGDGELNAGREAFRDFFRAHAGCEASSMAGEPQGCVDYDGCDRGTPVTFCSHPAGHVWPSIGTDATKAFFERFYAP